MSARSVRQRFSLVSLLIILSLLLPVSNLPGSAQQPSAAPIQTVPGSPVMFIENAGQFTAGAPDAEIAGVLASAIQVAAGGHHTCALTTGGGVKCWGWNYYGQLGDGTTTTRTTPVDVSGLAAGVTAIAAGREHTCALTAGGGVKCWGWNGDGRLGDDTTTTRTTPVDVSSMAAGVTAIAAGGSGHTCAVTAGGGVKCWGSNYSGQLGDGTTTTRTTPVDVSGLSTGVTAIAAGSGHTCVVTAGGGVKCWGSNYSGQLGDGTTTNRSTPGTVSGLTAGVTAIAAGGGHACALTAGGGVKCWGYGVWGQLGDGGSGYDRTTPVDVVGLAVGVTTVAAGDAHTCAVISGGGAKCWGWNGEGELGDNGTTTFRTTPVAVSGMAAGVTGIAAGYGHTCAVTTVGGVKCWGWNVSGQLGDGTTTFRTTPIAVNSLATGVRAIEAGGEYTCAITAGGGAKCWGDNEFGQLGDDSTTRRSTPIDVSGLALGVNAIAAGTHHTCALTSEGGVKCWGFGWLGDGSTSRHTPVDVSGLAAGVTAIAAGSGHTCVVTAGGGVKCWGSNYSGQLGDGTTTTRTTPIGVSDLAAGVAAIAAGREHTCALTTAGGVKCWGYNGYGQLGDGTTTTRTTPVDVSGLAAGVTAIATRRFHTCALMSGGGVKCWGDNEYGQLGDGTTSGRATPVDVVGLATGVSAIAVGEYHTCALTAGGGLKCWGSGPLGDGTTTDRTTPVDVVGLAAGVSDIAAGGHTCALTTEGGAKCWGPNGSGQLGVNPGWMPVDVAGFGGQIFGVHLPLMTRGR